VRDGKYEEAAAEEKGEEQIDQWCPTFFPPRHTYRPKFFRGTPNVF